MSEQKSEEKQALGVLKKFMVPKTITEAFLSRLVSLWGPYKKNASRSTNPPGEIR